MESCFLGFCRSVNIKHLIEDFYKANQEFRKTKFSVTPKLALLQVNALPKLMYIRCFSQAQYVRSISYVSLIEVAPGQYHQKISFDISVNLNLPNIYTKPHMFFFFLYIISNIFLYICTFNPMGPPHKKFNETCLFCIKHLKLGPGYL